MFPMLQLPSPGKVHIGPAPEPEAPPPSRGLALDTPRPLPSPARPPPLLTLKAGSCPSGARCNSRTSSVAFSQNMTDAPESRGPVNYQVTPNGRLALARGTSIVQSPTAISLSSLLWRQTGPTNRSALSGRGVGVLRRPRRDIWPHCATAMRGREMSVKTISSLVKSETLKMNQRATFDCAVKCTFFPFYFFHLN